MLKLSLVQRQYYVDNNSKKEFLQGLVSVAVVVAAAVAAAVIVVVVVVLVLPRALIRKLLNRILLFFKSFLW